MSEDEDEGGAGARTDRVIAMQLLAERDALALGQALYEAKGLEGQ